MLRMRAFNIRCMDTMTALLLWTNIGPRPLFLLRNMLIMNSIIILILSASILDKMIIQLAMLTSGLIKVWEFAPGGAWVWTDCENFDEGGMWNCYKGEWDVSREDF